VHLAAAAVRGGACQLFTPAAAAGAGRTPHLDSPASQSAKAKLRLLYECAPLAFVVEAAGGASHDGRGSVLDQRIETVDARTVISLGSHKLVMQSVASLKNIRAILF
jgi:Fructose-1-6-bisphosphatase, C-terminal domain